MTRVSAFTGGSAVPSARFRVRQYIPAVRKFGVLLEERAATIGAYPPVRWRALRPAWGTAALMLRSVDLAAARRADVTLLQREMISGLYTLERFTRRPRVLDVDDAIWIGRGRRAAECLARSCELVICGNDYLAAHCSQWNGRVVVLPTAVDTERYSPAASEDRDRPIIGWCGTGSTLRYLIAIEDALLDILAAHPQARLRIIADVRPRLARLPPERWEFVRWSAETEVEALRGISIGLMPMEESEWCLGKCSYKMLLYMSCARPVVVTPWGMNADILRMDAVGLGARSTADWMDAIDALLRDAPRRLTLGRNGRAVVAAHFSLQRLAPAFAGHLLGLAAERA